MTADPTANPRTKNPASQLSWKRGLRKKQSSPFANDKAPAIDWHTQPLPCARPLLRNEGICLPLKNSQSPKSRAQRLKLKIPNSTKWLLVVSFYGSGGGE